MQLSARYCMLPLRRIPRKMKRFVLLFLLLTAGALPAALHAQVSAYGEFSATRAYGPSADQNAYLYGVTTGVVIDGPRKGPVLLSADIQGRFVEGSGRNFNGVTVGPRVSFPMHHGRLTPFAEFMVGFARWKSPTQTASTDSTIQINGGVAKAVNARWDIVADYSYSQFYGYGGEYNPKTVSLGLVYHFVKR